jgi:hypothetical protein
MREDGDLRVWTRVDVLPPDGMQEVSGSSPLSSTQVRSLNRNYESQIRGASTAKYCNRDHFRCRTCVRLGSSLVKVAGVSRRKFSR